MLKTSSKKAVFLGEKSSLQRDVLRRIHLNDQLLVFQADLDIFKFLLVAPVAGIGHSKDCRQLGHRKIFGTVEIGLPAQLLVIRKFRGIEFDNVGDDLPLFLERPMISVAMMIW